MLSELGIYHKVSVQGALPTKLGLQRKGCETFSEKCKKVYWANLRLTFVFMITYYILISDAVRHEGMDFYDLFCLSCLLTFVSLLTIRILANQPEFLAIGLLELYSNPKTDRCDLQKKYNEKAISHFHTLICTSIMILGIVFSASILTGKQYIPNPQMDQLRSYLILFSIYLVALPVGTFLLELIFLFLEPIVQKEEK